MHIQTARNESDQLRVTAREVRGNVTCDVGGAIGRSYSRHIIHARLCKSNWIRLYKRSISTYGIPGRKTGVSYLMPLDVDVAAAAAAGDSAKFIDSARQVDISHTGSRDSRGIERLGVRSNDSGVFQSRFDSRMRVGEDIQPREEEAARRARCSVSSARMENEKYSSANRKLKTYLSYGVVLLVVFAFAAYKATKDRATASVIATTLVASVFLIVFLICDVTLRLCQTLVSFTTDVDQQSGESYWSVARYHFALNTPSATIVVIGALLVLCLSITIRRCPVSYAWDFGPYVCVPLMIFSVCLFRMSNLAEWETGSLSDLSHMKGLDYGTGMAYNFYYGYLRLVLPSSETVKKGIIEKIENFEDNHNVTFPVHKLFVLIPSSGFIPPDLKEASDQWMESAHELEEDKRNRAGNIGRTYRNNVYKIYPDGRNSGRDPVYAVVEGATPLLTFYEVQKHDHPESAVYKRNKRKIIEIFYTKLHEILQSNPQTRDLCELIYYNDYDANGDRVNVATIILERIFELGRSANRLGGTRMS